MFTPEVHFWYTVVRDTIGALRSLSSSSPAIAVADCPACRCIVDLNGLAPRAESCASLERVLGKVNAEINVPVKNWFTAELHITVLFTFSLLCFCAGVFVGGGCPRRAATTPSVVNNGGPLAGPARRRLTGAGVIYEGGEVSYSDFAPARRRRD